MELIVIRGQNFSSNSFILWDNSSEKILIVDLGLSGNFNNYRLREQIMKITRANKSWQIEVFLTHCHIDHILGYDNLDTFTNVTFSGSRNTAQHVNNRDHVTLSNLMGNAKIDFKITKIYEHNDFITLGKDELQVISTPGHTDGCAVLFDEARKSLFSGDVVFAGGASGRVDLPTGDQEKLLASLEILSTLPIEHLHSGHGDDLHHNVRENIIAAKEMLKDWF